MNKAMVLTFDSAAFTGMRQDMNAALFETLRTMYDKGCDVASITIKLMIDLEDDYAPDEEIHTHEAEREVVVPKIEHKVTSSMQIKSEAKGKIGGKGFELVREGGKFILKPIGPEQASLFDEECAVEMDDDDASDDEGMDDDGDDDEA